MRPGATIALLCAAAAIVTVAAAVEPGREALSRVASAEPVPAQVVGPVSAEVTSRVTLQVEGSASAQVDGPVPAQAGGPDSVSIITIEFSDARPSMKVSTHLRGGGRYLSDIALSAAFGVSVKWDPLFRLVTLAGRAGEATAVVGGTAAALGDRVVNLPDPFHEEPGTLLIPMSFITMSLHSLTGLSSSWDEASSTLSASAVKPSVLGVTLGGRPGLARVTVSTSRPLAYRVLEDEGELALAVRGAVPDSAFAVKGAAMNPLRGRELSWSGDELILRLALSGRARSFQTYREEYPQSIVLLVSSDAYREGFELEPLAGTYRRWGHARAIVLDPAHGGDDWGAVGRAGLKEKDVVLKICEKAASILRDRLDAQVYLTRDSDYRVPPAGRAEAANGRGADLYVSVHCDSWPGGGKAGYGVSLLPPAVKEGGYWRPEAGRSGGVGGTDVDSELALRPWRRAQAKYGHESSALARALLSEMGAVHGGPALGVREMPMVSLVGVDAPAVCVQCGYLDNSRDLELLGDPEGLSRLAAAIARGIEAYLNE